MLKQFKVKSMLNRATLVDVFVSRGILSWSQDQINNVWAHTHKKIFLNIQSSFLSISSLLLK